MKGERGLCQLLNINDSDLRRCESKEGGKHIHFGFRPIFLKRRRESERK